MTPDEIREHAAGLILDHARNVEYLSIVESLDGPLAPDDPDYEAVCLQIDDLIRTATITVEFPAGAVAGAAPTTTTN